jgi:hypothetical protein
MGLCLAIKLDVETDHVIIEIHWMLGEWRHPRIAHHHARVEILLLGNGNTNRQENEGQLHFYSYEH